MTHQFRNDQDLLCLSVCLSVGLIKNVPVGGLCQIRPNQMAKREGEGEKGKRISSLVNELHLLAGVVTKCKAWNDLGVGAMQKSGKIDATINKKKTKAQKEDED